MARSTTLSAAFKSYGAKGANQRWSWSARSEDGQTVVLTLWKDIFDYSSKPSCYDTFGLDVDDWTDTPGNRERLRNLIWARDNCGGIFRVVVTIAEDANAQPRSIFECYAQPNMIMKLVKLDEETGEFRAEMVDEG